MEWIIGIIIALIAVGLSDDLNDNVWWTQNRNQSDEYWMVSAFCLIALGVYALIVL